MISVTDKKIAADKVREALYVLYPASECGLKHGNDVFRLLIMAILSAQCTDKRVNIVAGPLFERFPDAASIAASEPGELEEYIRSVGLYNSKAKSIRACCRTLVSDFGGEVPSGMDDLLTLGGVGRKVANLIRGDAFGLGGIVADTHFIRICGRLGFTDTKDAYKVEKTMDPLIPKEQQSEVCHRFVMFGRDVCRAVNPLCGECILKERGLCEGIGR